MGSDEDDGVDHGSDGGAAAAANSGLPLPNQAHAAAHNAGTVELAPSQLPLSQLSPQRANKSAEEMLNKFNQKASNSV